MAWDKPGLWLSSWLPSEVPVAATSQYDLPALGYSILHNKIKWDQRCSECRAESLDLGTINLWAR